MARSDEGARGRRDADTPPEDDEYAQTVADAESSIGRSPEERMALFKDLLRMIDAIYDGLGLDEAERLRRIRATEELEPRPEPWWRDVRPEALP